MHPTIYKELEIQFLELIRPWKLSSLGCGVALLIVGSYYTPVPDWDVSISLLMASLTYLTASWGLRVIVERRWTFFPLMLFFTWFTVDGCYWLYWSVVDSSALVMRVANFPASLSLYFICGLIWLYRGTLRDLLNFVRTGFPRDA